MKTTVADFRSKIKDRSEKIAAEGQFCNRTSEIVNSAMQREYPQQPLVGVGAVVVEDGRVLLIKRGKAPLVGEWSIPGGMLELGETLRQAAEREALEETGLVVQATDLLGVFDRIVPAGQITTEDRRTLYHYVLIDFLCQKTGGNLMAAGDAADARWFTPEELDRLLLQPDTQKVLQIGIAKAK